MKTLEAESIKRLRSATEYHRERCELTRVDSSLDDDDCIKKSHVSYILLEMLKNPEPPLKRSYEQCMAACESEAEAEFLRCIAKRMSLNGIQQQVEIGRFRCDFVIDGCAIEIDGKPFHDFKRDMQRDAEILATKQVERVIRIPAAAHFYYREEVPHIVRMWLGRKTLCPPQCHDITEWDIDELEGWFRDREAHDCESYMTINSHTVIIGSSKAFRPIYGRGQHGDSFDLMHKLRNVTLENIDVHQPYEASLVEMARHADLINARYYRRRSVWNAK